MSIRIGTSGWSYPNGRGTWNGVFYPSWPPSVALSRNRATSRRFDELAYYAEHFDTVEVNSSFYRPPRPETARAWVRRTPPGFEFSLKLYQKFTHPQMFRQTSGAPDATISQADVDLFRSALDPIAEAGKLGAVLAQFPPSFKNEEPSRAYLAWLLRTFREYPIAVELRHRSWSDDVAATLTLLNEFGAAWVQIDEPKFRFSIRQNFLPNVTSFYYMRLHGRNAAHWWTHETTEDRYDYLYTEAELKPFAEIAEAARQLVRKLYLYLNNHFAAKSVANAVMIKQMLKLPVTGEYPPEFVARYPQLAGVVTVSSSRSVSRTLV